MDELDFFLVMVILCYAYFVIYAIVELWKAFALKIKYRPGVKFGGKIRYLSGLNVPEQTVMTVVGKQNEMILVGMGREFHIPMERILTIEKLTHTEVHHQMVSNPGGAVAGAMMGSVLGAIILGSPTLEKYTLKGRLVVLTYRQEENVRYIFFDGSRYQNTIGNMLRNFRKFRKSTNLRVDL